MSNDINRFNFAVTYLPSVLLAPVEVIFAVGLLAGLVGWPTLLGGVTVAFFTLLQVFCARKIVSLREKAVSFADKRVSLTSEVVRGIRLIKMCTWEESYEQYILDARRLVFYLLTGYFCNVHTNCECISMVNYIYGPNFTTSNTSTPCKYQSSLFYKCYTSLTHTDTQTHRTHTHTHTRRNGTIPYK